MLFNSFCCLLFVKFSNDVANRLRPQNISSQDFGPISMFLENMRNFANKISSPIQIVEKSTVHLVFRDYFFAD